MKFICHFIYFSTFFQPSSIPSFTLVTLSPPIIIINLWGKKDLKPEQKPISIEKKLSKDFMSC